MRSLEPRIRLPRTSPRSERDTFCKLLSAVDPEAVHGFGFEGKFLRAGSLVAAEDLRPDANFPKIPIILEYATVPGEGAVSRRRKAQLYILWRLDWETLAWGELGRSSSESWTWALDLRPLAARTLAEARGACERGHPPDLAQITRRIALFLDCELKPLRSEDRVRVVGILHDQLAARAAGR